MKSKGKYDHLLDCDSDSENEIIGSGYDNIIKVDVPLFIRLLEYAREDAKTDMDLHVLTERILKHQGHILTMEDYFKVLPRPKKWKRKV
jgi:hypothetical protein